MPVLGMALLKKKLDFNENVNNEEECFLNALNAYLRYIYEKFFFFPKSRKPSASLSNRD